MVASNRKLEPDDKLEIIKLLIQQGARVDDLDFSNRTPLCLEVNARAAINLKVVAFLLTAGSNPFVLGFQRVQHLITALASDDSDPLDNMQVIAALNRSIKQSVKRKPNFFSSDACSLKQLRILFESPHIDDVSKKEILAYGGKPLISRINPQHFQRWNCSNEVKACLSSYSAMHTMSLNPLPLQEIASRVIRNQLNRRNVDQLPVPKKIQIKILTTPLNTSNAEGYRVFF